MISSKSLSSNYVKVLPGFKQGTNYQKKYTREELIEALNLMILDKDFNRLNEEEKRFIYQLCCSFIDLLREEKITVTDYRQIRALLISLSKDSINMLQDFVISTLTKKKEEKTIELQDEQLDDAKTVPMDLLTVFQKMKEYNSFYHQFLGKTSGILTKEPALYDYVSKEILSSTDFREMLHEQFEEYFSFLKTYEYFEEMYDAFEKNINTSLKNKFLTVISIYRRNNDVYANYIKTSKVEASSYLAKVKAGKASPWKYNK